MPSTLSARFNREYISLSHFRSCRMSALRGTHSHLGQTWVRIRFLACSITGSAASPLPPTLSPSVGSSAGHGEIYWLIQGIAAWLVAPIVLAGLLVPDLFMILRTALATNPKSIYVAIVFGMLWGVGGLTFGLAIRYLGIALGYAIALGLCTAFGTLVPPIFHGQLITIAGERSGQIILLGIFICLVAVAVNGAAGLSKEREITPEEKAESGERDFFFCERGAYCDRRRLYEFFLCIRA